MNALPYLVFETLALLSSLATTAPVQTPLAQDPNPSSRDWVAANYRRVLDSVFDIPPRAGLKFPKNTKWLISIRITPPFPSGSECALSLQVDYDGAVMARIIYFKDSSLWSQLEDLRRRRPNASVEKLSSLLAVRRLEYTEKEIPDLTALARELESIRTDIILPDELAMDEVQYEIWSQSQWRNRMELVLGEPENSTRVNPLLKWVDTLRLMLLRHAGDT